MFSVKSFVVPIRDDGTAGAKTFHRVVVVSHERGGPGDARDGDRDPPRLRGHHAPSAVVDLVTSYYNSILGRAPDPGGLAFWTGEATRMMSLGTDVREAFFAMSVAFFNSAEYLNRGTSNTQYLTDLYQTFFSRAPDSGGLTFWGDQLVAGMDRGAMLNNFLFSTEFSNTMTGQFGSTTVRPEINLTIDLYRGILGVLPDSGGFNFWLDQIRVAQCRGSSNLISQVSTLSQLFIASVEYQQRDAARPPAERTRRYVGDLYNAFLRRGGDLDRLPALGERAQRGPPIARLVALGLRAEHGVPDARERGDRGRLRAGVPEALTPQGCARK
jgi:hypothetical protein